MFPKQKFMIYVLISLQTVHIEYTHPNLLLQMKLKNVFNYNILERHTAGHVLVWKITSDPEMLELQDYSKGFRTFSTDETYLLLVQKSALETMVHYWIGNGSSLENKMMVAKYALTMFTLIHEHYSRESVPTMQRLSLFTRRVFISREQESLVSDSFKHTIDLIKGTIQDDNSVFGPHFRHVDTQFFSKLPNLYVLIRNNDFISIKKIPILTGLKWLSRNDTCFILETAYDVVELLPITVYCGTNISNWLHVITLEIRKEFERAYFTYPYILKIKWNYYNDRYLRLKKMLEVLEDRYFYKFHDVDNSNDHVKDVDALHYDRSNQMSIFKVSNQGLLESVVKTNVRCDLFYDNASYIFNSASTAGLFFIFGKRTDVDEKVAAVQIMENYIHRTFSSSPLPTLIRITNGLNLPFIDDEVNLVDYPFIDLMINFDDWPTRRGFGNH